MLLFLAWGALLSSLACGVPLHSLTTRSDPAVIVHAHKKVEPPHESKDEAVREHKSSKCGFWETSDEALATVLAHRNSHETCKLKLDPNWIMCPSRVHDDQCEYFCPTYDITIQTPPEFDCPERHASQRPGYQMVGPGWIPYLAIDNEPLPGGILELLMSTEELPTGSAPLDMHKKMNKREFHKTPSSLQLRWEGGYAYRSPELHENEGYRLLRTYAGLSAQRFFTQAFGMAEDTAVKWLDDVFRIGDLAERPEFEIDNVHIDCSILPSGELIFDEVVARDDKHRHVLTDTTTGEWKTAEVNIWIALENQEHQPFIILDNSPFTRDDVCINRAGKFKLTDSGKQIVIDSLDAPHYSSAWKGLDLKPLRFGGLSMFHGKYVDRKASRFSVDFRFSVSVEVLEEQIAKLDAEKGAQYRRVLRDYLTVPPFVTALRQHMDSARCT